MQNEEYLNDLTHNIIGACIEVHRALGPGLLENIYQECLCHELGLRGLSFLKEPTISYDYKGHPVNLQLRADLIVENNVVLELKSVEQLHPVSEAQLMSYLKLTGHPIGLLVNFNVVLLKQGIVRRTLEAFPRAESAEDDNE